MKKKVMFINAVDPNREIEFAFPQLGLGYLASSLRKEFGSDYFKFKVIDRNVEEEMNEFKPDIVGITSVTRDYNIASIYAKIAKKHDLPVIIGGTHISALPFTLTNDIDVGVIGEGEETIIDLLNVIEKEGYLDNKSMLDKIDGVVFRRNNKLVMTRKRRPIQPLDKIAMPARDLFAIKKYTSMFTSRGCPYKCSFCFSSRFWEGTRFFSAEYVVNEIKCLVKEYGVTQIEFWDDLFIADRERVKRIICLLDEEGILGKVSFRCNARANLIDAEIVLLLKRMNVEYINLGLESGCTKTLEYLKGKTVTVNDNMKAVKKIKKHGIKPYASFIIGSPKESREDILQTLEFIKKVPLAGFDIYVLTPYPGTPVWDYAKAKNLASETMDWSILTQEFSENFSDAIILSEKLTKEELLELYLLFKREQVKKVARRTLNNPSEIPKLSLRILKRVLSGKPIIG